MSARLLLAAPIGALVLGLFFMVGEVRAQQHRPDGRDGRVEAPRQMSADDRAAFLDARLAAIHAGLRLSSDQEALWPPVEAAARERAKVRMDVARKEREAGAPVNLIEALRRHGETDAARGTADMRLADAALPLWASLSDDQKRRFPMLARGIINAGWAEQGPRGDHGRGAERRDRPGPRGESQ